MMIAAACFAGDAITEFTAKAEKAATDLAVAKKEYKRADVSYKTSLKNVESLKRGTRNMFTDFFLQQYASTQGLVDFHIRLF